METIINLSEIDPRDLPVVERVFGRQLDTNANFVLILRDDNVAPSVPAAGSAPEPSGNSAIADLLPDWCDMYAGLSEAEIADLESVILQRANLTRSID